MTSQGVQKETQEEILQKIALASANKKAAQSAGLLSKALSFIKAHPVIAIVSVIAGIGIATFAHFNDTIEETADKTKELMSSFESALDSANSNANRVKELSSAYKRLSKGVNNLGRNVSLTTEEYQEYNSIVNEIAEMFPTLVQGHTDEGNAILSLKGNVEGLTQAYKDAQIAAYNLLITTGEDSDGTDIVKNFQNIFGGTFDFNNENKFGNSGKISYLNQIVDATDSVESLLELWRTTDGQYRDWFQEFVGVGGDIPIQQLTEEDLVDIRKNAKVLIQQYQLEIDNALNNMHILANAYLMTNEDYAKLDKDMKEIASVLVNSFNEDVASGFEDNDDVGKYVVNILETIKANPDIQDALVGLFTTDFSDMPIEDAKVIVDKYIDAIADALDRDPLELKVELGFDTYDTTSNNYHTVLNNAAKKISGATDGEIINQRGKYEEYKEIYNKIDEFATEYSINTQDEIAVFQDALEKANYDIDKAFEYYLTQTTNDIKSSNLSISKTVDNLSTKLKPALDSLGSAYKDIFTSDGFTKENIGLDMLSSVKESIDSLNELDGISIDLSTFEDFARVLSDTDSTAEDIQKQFDSLASAITYATSSTEISTENFEVLTKALEEMGLTDARQVLTDIKTAQDEIIAQGYDLSTITAEQAEQFINSGKALGVTVEYLRMYMIQKELSNNPLSTTNDVDDLENLCNSLGVTGDLLTWVIKLKSALGAVENGAPIEAFQDQIDEARKKIAELSVSNYGTFQFDFEDNSSSSSKSATETLDEYFEYYENQLKAGQITYNEYVQKCNDIRDKYYNDGKITSKEYYQYLADLYEKELEYRDKAISAAVGIIEDQIDDLEKDKEELEEYYNGLIEKIQSEIDELKKANDERERAIALQKAQYELNRALHQRVDYIYQDGQFVYREKDSAVRDARNELNDQLFDMQISELEKRIEDLEEALEDATETIDEQIDALNEYKDDWSEIADVYEQEQNRMILASIAGAEAEDNILAMRRDTLEKFKDDYIRIQKEMANATVLASTPTTDTTGDTDTSAEIKKKTSYKVMTGNVQAANGFSSKDEAKKWATSHGIFNCDTPSDVVYEVYLNGSLQTTTQTKEEAEKYLKQRYGITKFHSGLDEGRVSKYRKLNDDDIVKMFQSFGNGLLKPDEVPALLKAGELVVNTEQQSNIAKNIQMLYQSRTNNPTIIPTESNMRKSQAVVEQHIEINCPNVTNESGVNYIKNALTSLTTKALQFDWGV